MYWIYRYSSHCHGQTGQFRYPDNCHKYIDCWRGQGSLKECFPKSLVFNSATSRCDWPRNVPCVEGELEQEEEEEEPQARSPQVDLSLRNCGDYTALGYKCVDFWECSEEGKIISNPYEFHLDARITTGSVIFPPSSSSKGNSSFDAMSKACPNPSEVCCRGQCSQGAGQAKKTPSVGAAASVLCPSDYSGLRPIPGLCTMFAECYKGRATLKSCPPGTEFCTVGNVCDFPTKVGCSSPP